MKTENDAIRITAFAILIASTVLLAMPLSFAETCTDSDGGKEPYVFGSVTGYIPAYGNFSTLNDTCYKPATTTSSGGMPTGGAFVDACSANDLCYVEERTCSVDPANLNGIVTYDIRCPNGCKDGACISPPLAPAVNAVELNQEFTLDLSDSTTDVSNKAMISPMNLEITLESVNDDGNYATLNMKLGERGSKYNTNRLLMKKGETVTFFNYDILLKGIYARSAAYNVVTLIVSQHKEIIVTPKLVKVSDDTASYDGSTIKYNGWEHDMSLQTQWWNLFKVDGQDVKREANLNKCILQRAGKTACEIFVGSGYGLM